MRNASASFLESASSGIIPVLRARLRTANGLIYELNPEDFIDNSVKFRNSTSSENSFDVGSVIISSFAFTLNNFDSRWDGVSFVGAQIDAYVGYYLEGTALESETGEELYSESGALLEAQDAALTLIHYGHYYMMSHRNVGNLIHCLAYDGLKLLDECKCTLTFTNRITVQAAVIQILNRHGLTLVNQRFPHYNLYVYATPEEDMTDRQVLQYLVQMVGCFARVDSDGLVYIGWYDTTNPMVAETLFSTDLYTEDVNITGVRIVPTYNKEATVFQGNEGYVLEISNNPFITSGNLSAVLGYIAESVIGLSFRPGSLSILSNPCYEVGDVFTVTHRDETTSTFIATTVEYSLSLRTKMRNGAASEDEAADLRQSDITVHTDRLQRTLDENITTFDTAFQTLTTLVSSSMGLYKTINEYEDGSVAYMFHDQPVFDDSQVIWAAHANAFTVSTDGGRTWNAGVDKNGNILAQVLTAIGVNADWVTTGKIQDASGNNWWDLDEGTLSLNINPEDIGAVTQTQLTALSGEISSQIQQTKNEVTRHYFVPDNAIGSTIGWYNSVALNDLLSFEVLSDGTYRLTIDGTDITSSGYYIRYPFDFDATGNITLGIKFEFDGDVTTLARQWFVYHKWYTTDAPDGLNHGFAVEVVDGEINVYNTLSGTTLLEPNAQGVYERTFTKSTASADNTQENFYIRALPGIKLYVTTAYLYTSTSEYDAYYNSLFDQRLDSIELSVSQLEQTNGANYVDVDWTDASLPNWLYDQVTTYPITGTTYGNLPSVDLDGVNVVANSRVVAAYQLNITDVGSYTYKFDLTTDATGISSSSQNYVAQFGFACANPDPNTVSTRPIVRQVLVTNAVPAQTQAAGDTVTYTGVFTVPNTVEWNGVSGATQLQSDATWGIAWVSFFFFVGTTVHITNFELYGSASSYAKAVLSIASDQIAQEVTRATTAEGELSTRILATESSLSAKVSAGDIASSLNMTPQSVKIDASKINLTGYVTASSLTNTGTTTIDGSRITTGTISANRITLGDTANYSQLNEDTMSKWGFTVASRPTGGVWYKMNTLARDSFISDYYTVNGGEYFRIKGNIWTTCTGATTSGGTGGTYLGTAIGLYCYKGDGSSAGIVYSGRTATTSTTKDINALVQIPSTARKMRVFVQTNGYAPFAGQIQLQNITVTRAMVGELIVDGSITVGKIGDGAVSAVKIADGTITAAKIASGTITADNIRSGTITATQLAANTITAAKLAATAIDGKTITGAIFKSSGKTSLTDANDGIYISASGLALGKSKIFHVSSTGALTATSATITGAITAKSGTIGSGATNKITIGTNTTNASIYYGMSSLSNTSSNGFYIGTDGIALGKGAFKVTAAGALTATSATITGVITAKSGTIGSGATNKITIGTNSTNASIYYGMSSLGNTTSNGFYIGTDGIALGKGSFKVTNTGALTATSATIKGNISGSTISGSTITVGDGGKGTAKLYINGSTGAVWAGNLNIMTTDGYPIGGFYQDGDTQGNATQNGHWMRLWTGHGLKISGELGEWFIVATYAVFKTHAYFWAEVYNADGALQFYSDRRTKQNIEYLDIEHSADTIYKMRPAKFEYKRKPGVVHHGLIAQDVQEVVTDDWNLVGECDDPETSEKILTLKYDEIIADLIATVQSQNKRIEALEKQVEELLAMGR